MILCSALTAEAGPAGELRELRAMDEMTRFGVFILIWAVYGMVGMTVMFTIKFKLKRRILPFYFGGLGVIFMGGLIASGFSLIMVLAATPPLAAIVLLSIKSIGVCPSCGELLLQWSPFREMLVCGRCGADLPRRNRR